MNEELLCPVCQHHISHHSDSYLAGCNEKLDTNPNRFCICYETRITIQLRAKLDDIEDILRKIDNWCNAYPIDIFPEPDLIKARLILESHRMSLDSISAHAMRHVVNGMRNYVQEALKKLEE